MDEKLRHLLDQLPERAPRSKLEPHREVIRELRKKRRTYAEIAAFFREHLQLSVAPSTIHEFVKTRARQARQEREDSPQLPARLPAPSVASSALPSPATPALPLPSSDERRERIRLLREQLAPPKPEGPRFQFDPEEPLTSPFPKKDK